MAFSSTYSSYSPSTRAQSGVNIESSASTHIGTALILRWSKYTLLISQKIIIHKTCGCSENREWWMQSKPKNFLFFLFVLYSVSNVLYIGVIYSITRIIEVRELRFSFCNACTTRENLECVLFASSLCVVIF
jgi:hypothetical protein